MEHGTKTGPEAVEVIDTTAREDKPMLLEVVEMVESGEAWMKPLTARENESML